MKYSLQVSLEALENQKTLGFGVFFTLKLIVTKKLHFTQVNTHCLGKN